MQDLAGHDSMSQVFKRGRLQYCKLLMKSAVSCVAA